MTPLEALRAKLAQLAGDMAALTAAVQAENRAMSEDEDKKFKALDAEYRGLEASIANMERAEEIQARQSQPAPRVVQPVAVQTSTGAPAQGTSSATGGTQVAHGYANHGFTKGFGEFLLKTREAAVTGRVDPRLMVNAVTTWSGETVGADGGFALPPQFVQGIMSLVAPEDSFIRALMPIPTQSDIITIPVDEDAPWSTSAITAAKTAEGGTITASKASVKPVKVVMYGVKSLVHVDEKSLRDMSFLSAYVQRKMGEKIRWKVENYILNGTGENEPLGILNAPGLLALTDAASTATVIGAQDVFTMKAACLPGTGCFWIVHPLVQPQIWGLKSDGTTTGYPLYTTNARDNPAGGALLGDPIFKSEAAKPLNTTGDILYVCPSGYFLAFEAAGPQSATTIAFAFDQNLQSFRTTLYMGGAPSLSAKVLRADGTNYASNLVAIAGSRS